MKDKNIFLNWFINSNGDIYPDVTLELDDFFIGNIYSNSLNDIYLKLENLSTKLLERNLSNVKCSHCSNALICKGGDSGRTYKEYKSFNMADPKCTFNQQ
ncbi:TPA: SPASM domain-containing protein [Clostridium perfringens]|nr:SPASM domain-containing protein [Clostridium perfringens]